MAKESIASAYVQIVPTTDGVGKMLSDALNGPASQAGSSAGSKLGNAIGSAAKIGLGAITATTGAMFAFGKTAVDAGTSFDSSMSQVAATMGFTVHELNTEGSVAQQTMETLGAFAQEMGSTTAFSASEAADALNYMALAGYDAQTSMDMLPTVLNLAAAGGIDLASASDMVTDAQSALGLSLEDTYLMVDEMAAAASKSNTSVAQLGEAFLTIGANARNLSGGTSELATALGLLADNGIKGAEGGTHLRNIMLSLNPTTDKAIAAWDALGVSAYDAQGNLRPLEDTFGDLNKALDGMSDQEKTDILTKMFNKTDLASVNALLGTSAERWKQLGDDVYYSADAAEAMANTQLDNLEGDVTLFKSALEGAQIAISTQLTPSLREFVQFGSNGLSRLTDAFKNGGLSGAMDELGGLLSEGLQMLVSMLPQVVKAGAELLKSLLNGIIQNLPLIIQTALDVVSYLTEELINLAPVILQAGLDILLQLALGIAQALPTLIPTIVDMIITIEETLIENLDLLVDASIQIIVALADGLLNALPRLIEKVPTIIVKFIEALARNYPKVVEVGKQTLQKLIDGIVAVIPKVLDAALNIITSFVKAISENISLTIKAGSDIVEGLKQGISDAWDSIKTWFHDKVSELIDSAKEALKIGSPSKVFANQVGKWIPYGIAQGIEDNLDVVSDAMGDVTDATLIDSEAMYRATASNTTRNRAIAPANTSDPIYNLLATYLPAIANGGNVTIKLEGDADKMFNAMKSRNNVYKRATGSSAFA